MDIAYDIERNDVFDESFECVFSSTEGVNLLKFFHVDFGNASPWPNASKVTSFPLKIGRNVRAEIIRVKGPRHKMPIPGIRLLARAQISTHEIWEKHFTCYMAAMTTRVRR